MLLLHGSVFVLASLWLLKRHLNFSLRDLLSTQRMRQDAPGVHAA